MERNDKMSTSAIKFCREVRRLAERYSLPFLVVTDGAWGYNKNTCRDVRDARIDHLAYKRSEVCVPNDDWNIEADDNEIRYECESDGCLVSIISLTDWGGDLYIDTNDIQETPHFHIRNRRSGLGNNYGFLTGIEFKRPAYIHQQDPIHVLDDDEKKALNDFFRTVVTDFTKFRESGITIWDMCCIIWNWNNLENEQLPDDLEMPDYTMLPPYDGKE